MKGVSSLVAIILMLLITISLVSLAYFWLTGLAGTLFNLGGNQTQQFGESVTSMFRIESVSNDVVFIRNIGQSTITKFSVYVNDVPVLFTANPTELSSGELGNITLTPTLTGVKPTDNTVKITTAQTVSATEKISGFTGTVEDNGVPVPGVTINIVSSGTIVKSTTTDSNGQYIVYISPGTYDIITSGGLVPIGGETIGRGQIKTVDIAVEKITLPGLMTYDLFIYGRGYGCSTPEVSHTLSVNGVVRFTFDPCETFGTSWNWVSFNVTDYVARGANNFEILKIGSDWWQSDLAVGIDNNEQDGNSNIKENNQIIKGELMIYINACNNLGCTEYRSDNGVLSKQVGIDNVVDDWAIKYITIP